MTPSTLAVTLFLILNANTEIYIRINQLGFAPADIKSAIAFSREPLAQEFSVVNVNTDAVVFTRKVTPVAGSWGEFNHHAELDFTSLRAEGAYVIELGSVRSPQFTISRTVNTQLPDQLLEFMRQQRCGYNPYVDAACHTFDGRTAFGPAPPGTYIDASGGWHDAGDQLKYLLTASNATAQMLLAYQLGPKHAFTDKFNDLGQPGANGAADVLDEALWGLAWMLRLHPAPDHLYHQVADDRDHKGFRLPQNETVDYGWGPGSYRVVYFADGQPQGLRQYKSESNGVSVRSVSG